MSEETVAVSLAPEPTKESYLGAGASAFMITALLLINIFNFFDRQLPFILGEALKRELQLSDTQLALMSGLAFALCYSTIAIPLARLVDRWSPKWVLVACIGAWSSMTALGGLAQHFPHLLLVRVGVAIGEAGCAPAALALIARLMPPDRRGIAMGIFTMGMPLGAMLGMAIGGWIAQAASWRVAFFAAGFAGLGILALTIFAIPEPRHERLAKAVNDSFSTVMKRLFSRSTFRCMFLAAALSGAGVYAKQAFFASFLIRYHDLTIQSAGLALGLIGSGGILGSLAGGRLFDWSGRTHPNRALLLSGLGLVIGGSCLFSAFFVQDGRVAAGLAFPAAIAEVLYLPVILGFAHPLAGRGNQGTSTAILLFAIGFFGAAVGPLAVGLASDFLKPTIGSESLRYALILAAGFDFMAGLALLLATAGIDVESGKLDTRDA